MVAYSIVHQNFWTYPERNSDNYSTDTFPGDSGLNAEQSMVHAIENPITVRIPHLDEVLNNPEESLFCGPNKQQVSVQVPTQPAHLLSSLNFFCIAAAGYLFPPFISTYSAIFCHLSCSHFSSSSFLPCRRWDSWLRVSFC